MSCYTSNVMEDEHRAVDLYVIGLGPIYMGIHTKGCTLESVIDEAKQLER